MKPGIWNLDIYEGEDFAALFIFRIKSTGVPVDLTGWSAQASMTIDGVRSEFTATVVSEVGGSVQISLDRADTTAMVDAKGIWDLFLITPSGKANPYLKGIVKTHATSTEVP